MNYRNHIRTAKPFTLSNLAAHGLLLVLWLLLCSPFVALATAKTAGINVSATLLAICTTGGSSNMEGIAHFGPLEFGSPIALNRIISSIAPENGGAIQVQCSKRTSFNVTLSGGNSSNSSARYLLGGKSGERVFYNLYTDPPHTMALLTKLTLK